MENGSRVYIFLVAEITTIAIQNIWWKFRIVGTVLNATFLLVVYFFYPETGMFTTESGYFGRPR